MRMRGALGIAAVAAILPATATFAAGSPPPESWGNVPDVALQPPPADAAPPLAAHGGTGWGPGGWQGGQAAARPVVPATGTGIAQPGYAAQSGDTSQPVYAPPPGSAAPRGHAVQPGHASPPSYAVNPSYAAQPGHAEQPGHASQPSYAAPRGYAVQPGPLGTGHAAGRGSFGVPEHGGYGRSGRYAGGAALRYGSRLPDTFLAPGYAVGDWGLYGLSQPGYGDHWVRYYDGAALVDGGGVVQDYRGGIDWDAGPRGTSRNGYAPGFDDGYRTGWYDGVDYAEDAVTYRGAWAHGHGDHGHERDYGGQTWDGPAWGGSSWSSSGYGHGVPGYGPGGASVYSAPGGGTVVVVQGGAAVTTTTTTEETISYAAPRHVWRPPARRWHPSPCCACRCR